MRPSRVGSSLSAKLLAGFFVVIIPALAVMVAIALYSLREFADVTHQLQEISRSLEAVEALEAALARAATPLSAYLVDGTPGEDQRFDSALRDVNQRLQSCNAAACHGSSLPTASMTAGVFPYVEELKDAASIIFGGSHSASDADKIRVLHQINRRSEEAGERINRMSRALIRRVNVLQEESKRVSRRATGLIFASVSLVLILSALTAYWLSRRLLKHVDRLLSGTQHIMQGDLAHRVVPGDPDEIGQLAESFNAMADELQQHREHLQRLVEDKTAELKRAQDSLIQSEKLASIGLLASGVAHELNNPLTSILMNVNLLIEEADQPALRAELQHINEDTVRCKRIIDDMRDFSRRHDLELVPSDLNGLLTSALATVTRRPEFERIKVSPEYHGPVPAVQCDPARMEQVLVNVLVNAAQAMPQGGALAVATRAHAGFAEIRVRDSGCGIPDAVRSRIFDPFFTTKPQGTGLGLSIVYRIMEAHSGRIQIESPPANGAPGTEVVLLLPLEAAHGQMTAARAA